MFLDFVFSLSILMEFLGNIYFRNQFSIPWRIESNVLEIYFKHLNTNKKQF